jgi:hypothetical protein
VLAAATFVISCRREEKPTPSRAPTAVPLPSVRFEERAADLGIGFVNVNGAQGKKWMPETMGGGVAVLDFDGDGRPDLLFVSGAYWPGDPRRASQRSSLFLFRNEGSGEAGNSEAGAGPQDLSPRLPRFRDVTRDAGLESVFYGMGAAVGDYDNDGDEDVYVTGLDGNRLYRNRGGRFDEVARAAGVRDSGWGTSAAFLDFDGDGLLDLFVCRYVEWSPAKDLWCTLDGSTKSYCTPERYPGTPSHLYRNKGDGTFEDVTRKSGVWNENQKALGVATHDFDGDGKTDFLVANDTAPNNLYRNRGDGTFEDVGVPAGVAVDDAGRSRGAMGAAWGDTKNGRGATLAIGNFSNELKSLYWTDTGEVFLDESPVSGVGPTSFLALTFGLFFFDADLDGRTDLLLANGHVEPTVQAVQKNVAYRQPPILYWNAGGGRFQPLGARAGDLERPLVARGAAYADLDGDGDLDVVIVESGGPAQVFVNRLDRPERSVRVRLVGSGRSNRDAIGARAIARIGNRTLTQEVSGGQSYLSAPEKTLTFGLGEASKIDSLEIRWPDGQAEIRRDLAGGTRLLVQQGRP